MPDHSIHNLTRPGFQATGGGVPHRPDGESESAWLMLDAVGGRVAFVEPGNAADQVRVAVHEAGHHHPSGGVYLMRVARLREILNAPAGTDFYDAPVLHQQCAIANDAEFFGPRRGSRGACKVISCRAPLTSTVRDIQRSLS
jgi:hypothetical protein